MTACNKCKHSSACVWKLLLTTVSAVAVVFLILGVSES